MPTLFQHALDVASLGVLVDAAAGGDVEVSYMVLDLKDAFMSIGLHPMERPFNTCEVERDLHLRRPRLHEREPDVGKLLVWSVLGFGGKPSPLVFAWVAPLACRAA